MAGYKIITVTQADIDAAFVNDSARCVVAQTLARTFTDAHSIMVDNHSIRFTRGKGATSRRYTYVTPNAVADYVIAFDAGDTIHPFTFRLYDDQRFISKRRTQTDKGSVLNTARLRVKSAERSAAKVTADPQASEAARTVAREKLEIAKAQQRLAAVEAAAMPGPRTVDEDVSGVPRALVRPTTNRRLSVTRGKTRNYGHRQMRVNNDPGPGDFRGPLDTGE